MKITKASISNYKSFKKEKIEDFSNVNMIYGHNNSGKSNLLKIISLIFERKIPNSASTIIDQSRAGDIKQSPLEKSSDFWDGIITNQPYIFREGANKVIEFEIDIKEEIENLRSVISFDILKDVYFPKPSILDTTITISGKIKPLGDFDAIISLEKVLLDGSEIFNATPTHKYFDSSSTDQNGQTLKSSGYEILNSLLGRFNDSVLLLDNDRYFIEEKESSQEVELTPKTFKNWFHNASLNPLRFSQIKSILHEVSTFKPNGDAIFSHNELNSPIHNSLQFDFARILNQLNIFLSNKKNLWLPLNNYGTGIQQILYMLCKIAEVNPKIVLIEEIELNLSPKYQYELLQHYLINHIEKPGKCLSQIFFTTHTPMLCFRADFQIHKISINEDGESKVEKVGDRKSIKSFYPDETIKMLLNQ
jgi:AAA15 family ATPase/GTPase